MLIVEVALTFVAITLVAVWDKRILSAHKNYLLCRFGETTTTVYVVFWRWDNGLDFKGRGGIKANIAIDKIRDLEYNNRAKLT